MYAPTPLGEQVRISSISVRQAEIMQLGVEWINDTCLCLIFKTAKEAFVALRLLSKVGFDPAGGDDPLQLFSAQTVPSDLLPLSENGKDVEAQTSMENGLVKTRKATTQPDDDSLPEGLRPGARMDIRYAVESDQKARTKAKDSQWYAKYGRRAGKEGAPERTRGSGRRNRSQSPTRSRRSAQMDLDRELDEIRSGRDSRREDASRRSDRPVKKSGDDLDRGAFFSLQCAHMTYRC